MAELWLSILPEHGKKNIPQTYLKEGDGRLGGAQQSLNSFSRLWPKGHLMPWEYVSKSLLLEKALGSLHPEVPSPTRTWHSVSPTQC